MDAVRPGDDPHSAESRPAKSPSTSPNLGPLNPTSSELASSEMDPADSNEARKSSLELQGRPSRTSSHSSKLLSSDGNDTNLRSSISIDLERKQSASNISTRPSAATNSSHAQVISSRSFASKWDSKSEEIFKHSPSAESVIDPTTLYFSEAFAAQFETEVQEAFRTLDADNNGSIDENELRDGIKAMGAKDDYIPEAMLDELRRTGNITVAGFREIVRIQRGCKMLEAHFEQHPDQRVPTKLTVRLLVCGII